MQIENQRQAFVLVFSITLESVLIRVINEIPIHIQQHISVHAVFQYLPEVGYVRAANIIGAKRTQPSKDISVKPRDTKSSNKQIRT